MKQAFNKAQTQMQLHIRQKIELLLMLYMHGMPVIFALRFLGGISIVDVFCELMIPLFMLTFVLIVVGVDGFPSDR